MSNHTAAFQALVTEAQTRATGVHQNYHRVTADQVAAIGKDRDALKALFAAAYPWIKGAEGPMAAMILAGRAW